MSTASFSSSSVICSRICSLKRRQYTSVAPPPGTIPSFIAALTELSASSYRSFLSTTSVSVGAPTLMRAMAARSLWMRCSMRCTSNSLLDCCTSCSLSPLSSSTLASTSAWCVPSETRSVFAFSTLTREREPSCARVASSTFILSSSVIRVAPLKVQMSARKAFCTSPKPGHLTAQTSSTPRSKLRMRADSASITTSFAMRSSGLFASTTASSTGSSSLTVVSLMSVTRTSGSSSVVDRVSFSLTRSSDSHPTSSSMPSETVTSSCISTPSSMIVAPSRPTLMIASAVWAPSSSELAEMEAICLYCSYVVTGSASSRILAEKKAAAFSSPFCSATALWPDEVSRIPSRMMACVSTVAVVVPSPARESVCDAACSSSLTPTFSGIDSRFTSPAMVTPSFTTAGILPVGRMTTLRPRGPMVTLTASATLFTPAISASRASPAYSTFRAIMATAGCCPPRTGRTPALRLEAGETARAKSSSDTLSQLLLLPWTWAAIVV
mmetsp:Transcript_33250/g.99222  ORF Transcript_33250/g.99222 Transcript_33250/m.99222 type:complete len:496 (+) Transcript_33250:367-1854(+)